MKAVYSNDAEQLHKYGVTVTTEEHADVSSSTAFRAAAVNTSHSNTYVHQMSWGPIPTVKLQQTYTVTGNGSTVVSSDSCSAINTNYTGVGNITESTSHSVVNGVGDCRTNWKASVPTPLGSVDLSSVQEQQINGAGAVVKENFYDL